ncbi:MAG TPA: DinB family protein [Terracidiphilus sp.]|jgi:hypothetical protein|nr:DinB family protein [Terracidiphilus sp.]
MKGRPEPNEAAAYYFTYIEQTQGDDALRLMEGQLEAHLPMLAAITEEKSLHRYAPGKWSLRQVVNHLADTERAFVFRALWFARGFDAPLPSYDPDVSAAGADADGVPFAAHVEELQRVRLATISLFRNLKEEAWMRMGVASGNVFSVRALGFIIPGHVEHHLRIVRERYL